MKLYYSPGACSLAPHIALAEAGLAFDIVRVDIRSHKLQDGSDYLAINPLGYVPLLELDDGSHLSECAVIMQYIADQAPNSHLAPANGTLPRYRLQEWLNIISTELHKGFSPLFSPGMPEEAKSIARQRLNSRLAWIDGQLNGKPFLTGEHFSIADSYLFTVTNWAQHTAIDLSPYPAICALRDRIAARPAVQRAMKAEGILK